MPGFGFPLELPIDCTQPRKWFVMRHQVDGVEVYDVVITLSGPREADLIVGHMSRVLGPSTTGYGAGSGERSAALITAP